MSLVASIVLAVGLLAAATNGPIMVATNPVGARLELYDEPGDACMNQAKRSVFQFGPMGDRAGQRVEGCYIVMSQEGVGGIVVVFDAELDIYKVPVDQFKKPGDAPGNT